MYLSNLDLFQSPEMLYNFSQEIKRLKEENPGFEIETRGLSRVTSFLSAAKKHEQWVQSIKDSGLSTVGFGHYGADTAESLGAAYKFTVDMID